MRHQLMIPRTAATLTRWSALFPGTAMPSTADALSLDQQLLLQQRDSELLQLLSGAAPAELELQVLNGSWPTAAPTPEQQADAERQQQIEAILANGNPYGSAGRYTPDGAFEPGQSGSLTLAMALEALDPEKAAQLKLQAKPPAAVSGLSEAGAAFVNAHLAGAR